MLTNVTEAYSFLGFTIYSHHLIKGYVKVAWPLYDLIASDIANHKKCKLA